MFKVDLLILAGGKGTRLSKIVSNCPKPLAPVAGIPFLDRLISYFCRFSSIDKTIIAVGYKKEMIIEKYQNTGILFSEEDSPLGTGGALKKAGKLSDKNTILVVNGDSFLECDVEGFIQFHLANEADFSLCTVFKDDTRRYGKINQEQSGRIQAFLEKSTKEEEGRINAGLYLVSQAFLDFLPEDSFSLEEALPTLLDKRIFSYPVEGFFLDIGTEESYHQAQRIWKNE